MSTIKKIIKNTRMIILLIFLVLAAVSIYPNPWNTGAAIRAISRNSSAIDAGIESPQPNIAPMSRERIIQMNNKPIATLDDYFDFTSDLKINRTVHVKTNKGTYTLVTKALTEPTAEQEEVEVTELMGLTSECIPGDADGDGDVDVFDWVKVRRILENLDDPTCGADADGDGDVDVFDWVKVRRILEGLD